MKKVIQFFLFNFNIELCCSYCLYKNLHKEHNVLEITNEKLLNKEPDLDPEPNLSPVYRLRTKTTGEHYYTTNENEICKHAKKNGK